MVESKPGFPVIVKLNTVPVGQYAQGNSLIVQGSSPEAVAGELNAIKDLDDSVGKTVLLFFLETALLPAVKAQMAADKTEATAGAAPVGDDTSRSPATESLAVVSDPPASANLLKAAAKKSGKTVEELGSITTSEAKRLIKEGK